VIIDTALQYGSEAAAGTGMVINAGGLVRGTRAPAAIAPGNATTGIITFPLTAAWDGLDKTEEGECHERKQILG
jgi:hypothetical protein